MVALTQLAPVPSRQRLTVQIVELAADTTAIRSLDWDRDRFDIEFGLRNDTTVNHGQVLGNEGMTAIEHHR